jgi:GTP-binding protein
MVGICQNFVEFGGAKLSTCAGIRRKRSTHEKVEIFSILKAKEAVERSHVVVLVLDAHEGITEQDATLLGMGADNGRAFNIRFT